tara:strand:- start:532 stop:846 length:315 start_codon:yes stop_codon:yes gene_type:complete
MMREGPVPKEKDGAEAREASTCGPNIERVPIARCLPPEDSPPDDCGRWRDGVAEPGVRAGRPLDVDGRCAGVDSSAGVEADICIREPAERCEAAEAGETMPMPM